MYRVLLTLHLDCIINTIESVKVSLKNLGQNKRQRSINMNSLRAGLTLQNLLCRLIKMCKKIGTKKQNKKTTAVGLFPNFRARAYCYCSPSISNCRDVFFCLLQLECLCELPYCRVLLSWNHSGNSPLTVLINEVFLPTEMPDIFCCTPFCVKSRYVVHENARSSAARLSGTSNHARNQSQRDHILPHSDARCEH